MSSDFVPTATLERLRWRARLLARLRQFFEQHDFLEVETPLLSADSVVDRHLDPFPVTLFADPRCPAEGPTVWLQTSPEFCMKRLVAAYGVSIYQVTRAFRAAERGRWHNPEFTMVEWYDVGADAGQGMQRLSDLSQRLLNRGAARRITYADAFQEYAGLDPHTASIAELRQVAARGSAAAPQLDPQDRDAWLEWLLFDRVEPHLGRAAPDILYDYPASQAALARVRDETPAVAERFELYVDGLELANGYCELLDAQALRLRMQQNNEHRRRAGKYALPENSRLLDAMRHGLPACSGAALGFDRLVALATGAASIDEVVAFPIERA
jgi:elongation factor P--(R)-beta-lysine ligase